MGDLKMNDADITSQIDRYYAWLKDKTAWRNMDEWFEITTPYLNLHGDYIQIYLKKTEDGYYLLTDDGATILGLEQHGYTFNTLKRKQLLMIILNFYEVSLVNDRKLQVIVGEHNFPSRKHSLIQAILNVSGMFNLGAPYANFVRYTAKFA
jgi:hypothetical protein